MPVDLNYIEFAYALCRVVDMYIAVIRGDVWLYFRKKKIRDSAVTGIAQREAARFR
jgi:hypothetical protein